MKRFDNDIIQKLILPCLVLLIIIVFLYLTSFETANKEYQTCVYQPVTTNTYTVNFVDEAYPPRFIEETIEDKPTTTYSSLDVPDIDSTFKAYMSYKKITDKTSNQYRFISEHSYIDTEGFLRYSANVEYGIKEDCYLIALGSFYGTEIGTVYRITTDLGNVFYGVLGDCKDDKHTDSNNQYTTVGTYNVVEFIVDTDTLNKDVKYHGSANWYEPLKGNIINIERIDVKEG